MITVNAYHCNVPAYHTLSEPSTFSIEHDIGGVSRGGTNPSSPESEALNTRHGAKQGGSKQLVPIGAVATIYHDKRISKTSGPLRLWNGIHTRKGF